jgi:hypothetical protein
MIFALPYKLTIISLDSHAIIVVCYEYSIVAYGLRHLAPKGRNAAATTTNTHEVPHAYDAYR